MKNQHIPAFVTLSLYHLVTLSFLCLLATARTATAHPVPREEYDRNITVEFRPDSVHIIYHVEFDSFTLFRDVNREAGFSLPNKGTLQLRDYLEAFRSRMSIVIPDKLIATFNGKPITFETRDSWPDSSTDSMKFLFHLQASWQPLAGQNSFELKDINFPDKPGSYKLSLAPQKEFWQRYITTGKEPKERKITADADESDKTLTAVFRPREQASMEGIATPEPMIEDAPIPPPPPSIWESLRSDNWPQLLDTNAGLWLILLLAAIHGAAHSLSPGHGKTMVAAYLVGERGTPGQAVLLGIVTTLTHTSAAVAVAALFLFVLPESTSREDVERTLRFIGGLMIAGVGFWLFLQRLAGRSDHVHLFDDHSHGGSPRRASVVRVILLGIAGGIIPCWGAVLWVLACISLGKWALALPVVLAFSAGLAVVLISLGLTVVYTSRLGSSTARWRVLRWLAHDRTRRWLPVVGASGVVVIGLVLCATSGFNR